MGNLLDYIDWRGDLTLRQSAFCDIDALVLSCLSYVDLKDIVPGIGEGEITLRDAAELFFEKFSKEETEKDKRFTAYAPKMMGPLAESKRFGGAVLRNFTDRLDEDKHLQFAALEIEMDDGVSFLAFRGTDDTMVGWREDFDLSYTHVPADDCAVEYVNQVCSGRSNNLRFGGHSKGGHLAMCAAGRCEPEIRDRLLKVYDMDGPGFNAAEFETLDLEDLEGKIVKVIPEESIVGRLLECGKESYVVKSDEHGIMQHSPSSWLLKGTNFETTDATGKVSDLFKTSMDTWLSEMDDAGKEHFVNDLFSVFEAGNRKYLSELGQGTPQEKKAMLETLAGLDKETGAKVKTLLKIFFFNWNDMVSGLAAGAEEARKKLFAGQRKEKKE